MTEPAIQSALARTRRYEDAIPWLYRDSAAAGNATCAIGHMVPSYQACQLLPFTPPITQVEWNMLHECPTGMVASFYERVTQGRLTDAYMDSILENDLEDVLAALREEFSGFDAFPDGPAAAILDLSYNLGIAGLLEKFPTMVLAIRRQDWKTAAEQCHRRGISDERNKEVAALFLEEKQS